MYALLRLLIALTTLLPLPFSLALAEKKYDPGASDAEIKIGQTIPYSGPASAYGTICRTELAYFEMLNEQGGSPLGWKSRSV